MCRWSSTAVSATTGTRPIDAGIGSGGTGIARRIISQTFAVFEVFIVAGAIYLVINFLITRLIRYAEWRLTPYLRRPA